MGWKVDYITNPELYLLTTELDCGKFDSLKVKPREVNAEDDDANPYSTFEEIETEVNPYFTHEIPNSPDR